MERKQEKGGRAPHTRILATTGKAALRGREYARAHTHTLPRHRIPPTQPPHGCDGRQAWAETGRRGEPVRVNGERERGIEGGGAASTTAPLSRLAPLPRRWNFTPSPGWTTEEAATLKLCLMHFGVGKWKEIQVRREKREKGGGGDPPPPRRALKRRTCPPLSVSRPVPFSSFRNPASCPAS